MILLITYDLRQPGRDYTGLYTTIKAAGTWWHHFESTWIIETELTPREWYDILAPHFDSNDIVFIVEITKNQFGWLPEEAWKWLSARNFRY